MRKVGIPVLVLLLFVGCRKEKFSSESEWLAPIFQTEISLADLVPDSVRTYNEDSSINIVFEEEYGVSDLSDILVIPDKVDTMEVTLSSLALDDRTFTDTLTLAELYPPSILLNGRKSTLDAQEITANEGTVIDVTDQFFTEATFIEGWIDISIANDLPVEAEILEFELRNDEDKEVIVAGSFQNLAPNTSVRDSFSLAGKTVKGVLELIVKKVKTKASNGEVQIDAFKGLRIEFSVRDLKPQKATAIFPAQNLVEQKEESKYDFGGAKLTEITIQDGFILMEVESSIEEAILIEYTIPNSERNRNNIPIKKSWRIPAAEPGKTVSFQEKFSIAGYRINMFGATPFEDPTFNHIYSELIASIEYSGIERTLSLEDKIQIQFGLVDVKPKLVIGNPGFHQFETVDSFNVGALKNLSGRLSLDDASLDLDFYNSFGIEANLDVNDIRGRNTNNGREIKLSSSEINGPIELKRAINGAEFIPFEKSIRFDKSNSNFKQFIENIPNQIVTDFQTTIRPYGTLNQSDFAFDTSKILISTRLEVPLTVGLEQLQLSGTSNVSLFQSEEIESIQKGKITLVVDNSFPIEGGLTLTFYDQMDSVLLTMNEDNGQLFRASPLEGNTSKTAGLESSELIYSLSPDQMLLLQQAKEVKLDAFFNTTDLMRYKIFADYTIKVKAITDIVYEIDL